MAGKSIRSHAEEGVQIIPPGWSISRVGEALQIENSKRKPLSSDERSVMSGPYPYYGPTRIQGWLNKYAYSGRYALIGEDGDHFLKYRSSSMTQIADGRFNVNNHAHVIGSTARCMADWFYFYFENKSIESHLTRQGAKRYKLTKSSLEKIEILLPPPAEQKQIVEILTVWDRAVDTVESLIANARAQKLALMQELLTGRSRLPGFGGEWERKPISAIATRVTRRNERADLPVLTISSTSGFVRQDEKYSREMAGKSVESYIVLSRGEFAYNKGNSKTYQFGCIYELTGYEQALVPHVYVCFRLKQGYSRGFYGALFEADYLAPQLGRLVNTGVRNNGLLNITAKEVLSTTVPVPSKDEQDAIAVVLEAASTKVIELTIQRDALRKEKAALMQQLLTGKRRVRNAESRTL